MDLGNPDPSKATKTQFEDLARLIENDYIIKDRASLLRLRRSLGHLRKFFNNSFISVVTFNAVEEYKAHRKMGGAANATINREIAALKRAFNLGKTAGSVFVVPAIGMLQERNQRTGFFEREEYDALLSHLPQDIRPVIEMAYCTGWRIDSEILTR